MIEEKMTRSKDYCNKEIEVCAKSVKFPIVLLQRLHVGANGAILAKEIIANKLNISGNTRKHTFNKKQTSVSTSNEKTALQCTNPIDITTVLQSTLTDSGHEVGLPTTKSYKFKKTLKRLQTKLNKKIAVRSGNKLDNENSMIIDKTLSEKITEDPKLLTDMTAVQKTEISSAVTTRKKLCEKIKADDNRKCTEYSNSKQYDLISNSPQDQISYEVSTSTQVLSSSDFVNDTSTTEETVQLKASISTRSRLLKKPEVDIRIKSSVENSLQNICTTRVDNNATNVIYIKNKSREIAKSNNQNQSTANACPVKISSECVRVETIEKVIPMNETANAIDHNHIKNSIKTRSKVQEITKIDNSESLSVPKSTTKQISNKSSLNKKAFQHEMKKINSTGIEGNNIKKSVLTRSKLSDMRKADDYYKSFVGNETTQSKQRDLELNLSGLQTNSLCSSLGKTLDNLKLTSDTITAKATAVRRIIPTRSKLLEKMKIDDDKNLKTRQSFIGNESTGLLQASSISLSSQVQVGDYSSSFEEVFGKSKVSTDSLTIKENRIVKRKISTRSKLLEKKKTDDNENDTVGKEVIQPEANNSTPISTETQFDNEPSISGNVLDQSTSLIDLNKSEEAINERKKITTRSKIQTLDKKNAVDPEQQSEKPLPAFVMTGKKFLPKSKLSVTSKVMTRSLKTTDDGAKNIISTRSRLLEKIQIDDHKKLTIEKPSIDTIVVQSKQNQIVSTSIEVQTSSELPSSEKLLDSSKHLNDTISTRSKVEKKKTNNHEKSVENETIRLEQDHSTPESSPMEITEEPIPNGTEQDSLKLLTDIPNSKESTSTRSKSNEKKKKAGHEKSNAENEVAHVEQNQFTSKQTDVEITDKSSLIESPVDSRKHLTDSTIATENMDIENTISSRSEMLEKSDEHDNDNLDMPDLEADDFTLDMPNLETNNFTSNSSEAEISNKSLDNKQVVDSPKPVTDSSRIPKKIDVRSKISTRSKLRDKSRPENHEGSSVQNEAVCVEQNRSILNSSQVQSTTESKLDENNSILLPHAAAVNIDDLSNTISTRSGLTPKKRSDVKPSRRKKKALGENQCSSSKPETCSESIAEYITDITLGNEINNCNINRQQQVCREKEILIKLFRCDQDQIVDNCATKKHADKNKSLQGKRNRECDSIVEEIASKAKKSKQIDNFDNSADLVVSNENQQLVINNEVPLITIEVTDKSVVESQSNVESNGSDINVTKSIENVSENCEATEKDLCLENMENINSITENSEISQKENQCDDERVENQREIIVNSSGDNNSVHEVELLEDVDEGISVDTSENETNAEIHINSDNVTVAADKSTNFIRDKERHNLLARKMVEEVINDWAVADDDKTDNTSVTGVNENFSTPEVIQIDDNEELDVVLDVHQQAVNTETEKDPSHNSIPTPRENVELICIDVSDSPEIQKETSTNATDKETAEDNECNNIEQEVRESNSTSEQTSEMSEAEDIDDSNFESVDESSYAEIFANENCNHHEDNVSQETITYYNSEDISMDVGVSANPNRMNDVVMNLKDVCDKITADLSGVDVSYENNNESSNHEEPELLYISDDSNGMEEEEEVVIIEPPSHIDQPQPSVAEQQNLLISNQLRQVIQQGTPSISVIKASELRDEILGPPVEYPIKPSGQQVVVYPQRQMLSTTLLPANLISGNQCASSLFTENSIMQCPKCRGHFVGKSQLRHHWLTCGDVTYLCCPFCKTQVKQRRSLIYHLNTQHLERIDKEEVAKVVDRIVKQTREVADVNLQEGSNLIRQDSVRRSSSTPIIKLPAFIRIQCVLCNKTYNEVPATYKKICDECSSDLMTAICQLCRKQYMLSTKIALHVQGNCIFTGRIKCQECDFVGSSKYNLQEHIIRKHIYVAPEDYIACRLGCGKNFRIHDALRKHERICGKEANLNCRFCSYKTKHRSAMKMHVQQHIVHEKLTIGTDGTIELFGQPGLNRSVTEDNHRDLTSEQEVRSVIRVHCFQCNRTLRLTNNRSSCEICKLSFTFSCSRCSDSVRLDSLHAARLHVIRSHCVKIHECPYCGQKFSYVYDLSRHASKCKKKMLSCQFCNYHADHENKLREHMRRVHYISNSDPAPCKKCGKQFARDDSLRRHENSHCGIEAKISCEHCHFKTKSKFSLLRHIQSQHAYIYENFNFVCDRCNKFYTNMFAYEVHVKNCHALKSSNKD